MKVRIEERRKRHVPRPSSSSSSMALCGLEPLTLRAELASGIHQAAARRPPGVIHQVGHPPRPSSPAVVHQLAADRRRRAVPERPEPPQRERRSSAPSSASYPPTSTQLVGTLRRG